MARSAGTPGGGPGWSGQTGAVQQGFGQEFVGGQQERFGTSPGIGYGHGIQQGREQVNQPPCAVQRLHQIEYHLGFDGTQFALNPGQIEPAGQANGFVPQLAQGIGNHIGLGQHILFIRRAVGLQGIMNHGDTHGFGSFPGVCCGGYAFGPTPRSIGSTAHKRCPNGCTR